MNVQTNSTKAQRVQETLLPCLDGKTRQWNQLPLGKTDFLYLTQVKLPMCTEMDSRKSKCWIGPGFKSELWRKEHLLVETTQQDVLAQRRSL